MFGVFKGLELRKKKIAIVFSYSSCERRRKIQEFAGIGSHPWGVQIEKHEMRILNIYIHTQKCTYIYEYISAQHPSFLTHVKIHYTNIRFCPV